MHLNREEESGKGEQNNASAAVCFCADAVGALMPDALECVMLMSSNDAGGHSNKASGD